jgi:glycosyltransferase involved in cell wall biosynthesis
MHHAKHSGYDILVNYLENCPFKNSRVAERLKSIKTDKFRKLPFFSTDQTSSFYFPLEFGLGVEYSSIDESPFLAGNDEEVVNKVYDLIIKSKFATKKKIIEANKRHICHFIYGHLSFRYFKCFPLNHNIKAVMTIHEVPDWIKNCDYKYIFKKADAIILMSQAQKHCLKQITGKKNVFVVPHGIDTSFFRPLKHREKNDVFTTICVGEHLRDVATMVNTIRLLKAKRVPCRHRVVTFKEHFHYYKDLDNIELLSGISDEELRKLYQTADCLLMPLKDATTNNAILESMACGIPIVSTNVGGMKEYVNDKCAFLERKGSCEDLARRVIQLKNDPKLSIKMGIESRKRAMDFGWRSVSEKTKKVYMRI